MKKNQIIGVVVVLVVVAGIAFYAGSAYGKGQTPTNGQFTAAGGFGGAGFRGGTRTGGSATTGQIVSSSASSLSIKLASGSTQIVLISDTTPILKSVSGTVSDLTPGTTVIVSGSTNSDGSMTASSIQIRPASIVPPGQATPTATQ